MDRYKRGKERRRKRERWLKEGFWFCVHVLELLLLKSFYLCPLLVQLVACVCDAYNLFFLLSTISLLLTIIRYLSLPVSLFSTSFPSLSLLVTRTETRNGTEQESLCFLSLCLHSLQASNQFCLSPCLIRIK